MMNIALITDENYVTPTGTAIASVLESNPGEQFAFYIVTKFLSQSHVSAFESFVAPHKERARLKIIAIDDADLVDFPLRDGDHVSAAAYYRIFFPSLFDDSLSKILYLDGDILCVDSLRSFYDTDLEEYSCAVTHDERNDDAENFTRLKYPQENGYFCSGVMLINLDWWRKNGVMQKCLDYIASEPDACLWHDQDALNHVLNGTVLWASFRYNFMQGYFFDKKSLVLASKFYPEVDAARKNPCILHFSSAYKPWHYECNHPLKKQYRKLYKKYTHKQLRLTHKLHGIKLLSWRIKKVLDFLHICHFADFRKPVNLTIAVYIHKIMYKYGGTEAYTAKLLECMQDVYPASSLTLITESFAKQDALSSAQMIARLCNAYGCVLSQDNFSVAYIHTKDFHASVADKKLSLSWRLYRSFCTSLFLIRLRRLSKKYAIFINASNQLVLGNANRNITLIHFPHTKKEEDGAYTFFLLKRHARVFDQKYADCYEYFLPNSQFTAYWLKQRWHIADKKIRLCYPPVTPVVAVQKKVPGQIVICSRIEASKKIDVMIKAFCAAAYIREHCVLKIAGSPDNEDYAYIAHIQNMTESYANIQLIYNPSRAELESLYAESGIFWHAKGYGETDPMLMEHFGMTTVEAMSAGCIPVVINKGGQKEIVTAACGFTWDEPEQLVSYTEQILQMPAEKITAMRNACIEQSKMYAKEKLREEIRVLLQN